LDAEFTLKTFHVYLHPARGYEAVPEGPCLPALCFSVFWLVFRGLAVPATIVLIGTALVVGAEATAGRNATDEIQAWSFRLLMIAAVLALWLLPFLYGNRWRHADLLRRGFAQVACLRALSGDDAVARALSLDTLSIPLQDVPPATSSAPQAHAGPGPEAPAAAPRPARPTGAVTADQAGDGQPRRDRRTRPQGLEATVRGVRNGGPAGDTLLAAR
jgi:hypothetical protein